MIEEWRPCPGYEQKYEVSSYGRVRRKNGRVRALFVQPTGYVTIALGHGSLRLHRLIATAFIRPGLPGEQVNHIDLDKTNNRVENLEWCTARENIHHARLNNRGGGKYRLTEPQVLDIRERYASGEKSNSIGNDYGLTANYVVAVSRGVYYAKFGGSRSLRGSGNYPRPDGEVSHG